jgi:hypothetical protein
MPSGPLALDADLLEYRSVYKGMVMHLTDMLQALDEAPPEGAALLLLLLRSPASLPPCRPATDDAAWHLSMAWPHLHK